MIFGARPLIGLDIGSSFIKAVQIKDVKGSYELSLFDMIPIAPELIVDGSVIDSMRLMDFLKELKSKARVKTKDCVLSMSGHSSVIIKRIALPEMSEEELAESISFEAEQYVPFDIDDVNIDFQILGPKEEPGQMDVILVAVKKDIINEFVTVAKDAGFNPTIVDVDAFALENMYEVNYDIVPEANTVIVNIGASTITLNILKGGVSAFTRDSAIGGNIITEAIQKEFNVSYDDAEKLKLGESLENVSQDEAMSIVYSASEDIFTEVSRSIDYFRSTSMQEEINEVVLCGGCALIKNFDEMLAERINVNVSLVEPFRNVRIPDKMDSSYIKEMAPMAAVAVGLALRRHGDR
ncbi:competence protein A [bacterium BMS3Abin07]|nr:competence protein A [bacterium BMS3Abin07]GBE32848.1 competence protein A [bacterium BMS3Bbin05]HDZ88570.1 type IV pilus assembly protein PilM [Nitrospirota bacterium]